MALLLPRAPGATAGCLAPADVLVDVSGAVGPLWGADSGQLLYTRGTGGGQELVRRGIGEFAETVGEAGEQNGVAVGFQEETWHTFHGGAINDRGDAAFVASTTIDDDPETIPDESIPRRGAYVFRGNSTFELGRFGGPSPIDDVVGASVPWGSFFDAVPLGRPTAGLSAAVFSAQLGAPDGRQALFHWDELSGDVTPLVLTGQPSPAGGNYTTFGRLRCNEAGDVVFYALTQVTSTAPIAAGLFRISRDALPPNQVVVTRIVKFGLQGDEVAGIGRFSLMQDYDIDGAGGVAFTSSVEDGPARPSGLFRWNPATLEVTRVLGEGDPTPLGGQFGTFTQSQIRVDETGGIVFQAPITGELSGAGFFTVPPGSSTAEPLGTAVEPLGIASLGSGRLAYQTGTQTRRIVPADGTEEGPKDYRVAAASLANTGVLRKDRASADLRFLLPPWGTGEGELPPAVFVAASERFAPTKLWAGAELARLVEVRVQLPSQGFVFGIAGTADKPVGTLSLNGTAGSVSKFSLGKSGDTATWKYAHSIGSGTFSVDLTKGLAKLSLTRGNLFAYDANLFRVELTLRTDADVNAGRLGALAYFHRGVLLRNPTFAGGSAVTSRGESLDGGTFYADTLRIDRKLKAVRGQPAPQVTSDRIKLLATLRLCPGSSAPTTPTLGADVAVGDLVVNGITLSRVGKKGSKYTGRATVGGATATLTIDVAKGTVSFAASNVPPLSQLTDADFSGASATNGSKAKVGGMTLPVSIHVDRVYEAALDVPMVRLPGGKAFTR